MFYNKECCKLYKASSMSTCNVRHMLPFLAISILEKKNAA